MRGATDRQRARFCFLVYGQGAGPHEAAVQGLQLTAAAGRLTGLEFFTSSPVLRRVV